MKIDQNILGALKDPKYQKIMNDNADRVRKLCVEIGVDYGAEVQRVIEDNTKCGY